MEILNIGFIILLIKLSFCVLPGVGGCYLIFSDRDRMRSLRAAICRQLFGVSNAFEYSKFSRFMRSVGVLLVVFSFVAVWFLFLRSFFVG